MIEVWLYVLQSMVWSFAGFCGGYYVARLGRNVDTIKEAAVSDDEAATYARPDRPAPDSRPFSIPRWVGIAIIVLSIITVGQAWYFAQRDRAIAECQATTVREFQTALAARNNVNDEDRRVIDKLVLDITQATTREQSRAALEAYVKARATNDAERAKNPLPGITNCEDRR